MNFFSIESAHLARDICPKCRDQKVVLKGLFPRRFQYCFLRSKDGSRSVSTRIDGTDSMTESYKFYEPVAIEPFILQLWRRQVVRSAQGSPLASPKPPQNSISSSFYLTNPNSNSSANPTSNSTTSTASSASGSLHTSVDGDSESSPPVPARVQEPYQMAGYLGSQGGMKVPKFTFRKSDRLSNSRDKQSNLTSSASGPPAEPSDTSKSLHLSADALSPFARTSQRSAFGREGPSPSALLLDADDDFGYKSPFGAPPPSKKGTIAFDDDDGYRSPFGPPPARKSESTISTNTTTTTTSSNYPISGPTQTRSVPMLNIAPTWGDYPTHSYSANSSGRNSLTNSNRSSPPRPEQDSYQVNFYRNGELVAEPKHDPALANFSWVGTGRWSDRSFNRNEICDMFRDLCNSLGQQIDCPIIMPDSFTPISSGSSLARGSAYGELLGKRDRPHPFDDEREAPLSDSPRVPNSVSDYPDLLL